MPQDQNKQQETTKQDTTRPRNESTPGQANIGTSTSKELDDKNSPDVREALNESQL